MFRDWRDGWTEGDKLNAEYEPTGLTDIASVGSGFFSGVGKQLFEDGKMKSVFLAVILAAVLCVSSTVFAVCPSMDVTGDCKVNLADFAALAEQWLQEGVKPYSELNRADIAAMEAEMSTASIDASNGNEFMPGTYLIEPLAKPRETMLRQ